MGGRLGESRLVERKQDPEKAVGSKLRKTKVVLMGNSALPAYACALHPTMACWAWSGRSSKLAIRQISTPSAGESSTNGYANGQVGKGPLGGEGKVIETGKGKFGMDVKFVSSSTR